MSIRWPNVARTIGIALMLQAELGVSPYDVLHQGLADVTGLSFGTIVVGLGLLVLVALWLWSLAGRVGDPAASS